MKKKLKGFTLVELIIVVAIFGLIMVAVLSILNPIADVYASTANYEHMRASCDNVRLYVEDNLKYADKLRTLYNANHGDAITSASDMSNAFVDSKGKKFVGTSDNPIYIMEIDNKNNGRVSVFTYINGSESLYKKINENLYNDYSYKFVMTDEFKASITKAALDIEIEKYVFDSTGSKVIPPETDDRYIKLSSKATFSFVNLRNINLPEGTEVKYIRIEDGQEVSEDTPGAVKVDATKPSSNPFEQPKSGSGSDNIYFIYTLPKFVNQYN